MRNIFFLLTTISMLWISPIAYSIEKSTVILDEPKATTQTTIDTLYGQLKPEPLIFKLISSPALKRIQKIDQSGALYYFGYVPRYTRYDHCIGVWALLKRFERPFSEQVAGLLHDASHTVFSHTGDYLFHQVDGKNSYQDTIHLWFLEKMKIQDLISDYGLSLEEIHPENENNIALEQDLPDLCADRIEYNLHTGLLFRKITHSEFKEILMDLHFESGRWFFTNPKLAKTFSDLPLYFTQHLWGAPWNNVFNHYFAEILSEALRLKLITEDTIHFGTDEEVLAILEKSTSHYIQVRLSYCRNIHRSFTELSTDANTYDLIFKPKFRGIDPWVKTAGGFKRLTELDSTFNKNYQAVKQWTKNGSKVLLRQ